MSDKLRVLDLFSGLGGASCAFVERGHEVVTVDITPAFEPTVCADVLNLSPSDLGSEKYDFVWASPPCPAFSKLGIQHHWTKEGEPKTEQCRQSIRLVEHALFLIEDLDPRAWIMENPVGKFRTLDAVLPYERRTVTYCRYGYDYRKATDLIGGFPGNLDLLQPCRQGKSCHQPSPSVNGWGAKSIRDADPPHPLLDAGDRAQEMKKKRKTGGVALHGGKLKAAKRALVPHALSQQVCQAMETFQAHWHDAHPRITNY